MGLVLAVLTGKTIVRNHRDDLLGRGTLGGINHQQQLEKVVGGRDGGLDDEDRATADGVFIGRLEFSVGILENGGISKRNSINIRYSVGQIFCCTARKNEYFISFFFAHFVLILRLQSYTIFLDYCSF